MSDTGLSLVKSHASQLRTGRVTLLERKTALDQLAEIAGQARSGEGRLVLVEGEAGVGKSALLEQFAHDLPDSRLLSGACDGMFTPRPLGPLFDIAQQVHGRLQSLCRADASREQLFDALLTELCEPGPLPVVVIEDVHWADEATLDLAELSRATYPRDRGAIDRELPQRRVGRHPSAAHCSRPSGRPALHEAPSARSPQCPSRADALGRPRGRPRGALQGYRRQPVLCPRGT